MSSVSQKHKHFKQVDINEKYLEFINIDLVEFHINDIYHNEQTQWPFMQRGVSHHCPHLHSLSLVHSANIAPFGLLATDALPSTTLSSDSVNIKSKTKSIYDAYIPKEK